MRTTSSKFGMAYDYDPPLRLGMDADPVALQKRIAEAERERDRYDLEHPENGLDSEQGDERDDENRTDLDDPVALKALIRKLLILWAKDRAGRGENEPPPFEGRPRPGGAVDRKRAGDRHRPAMDSDASGFLSRFPDARRIGIGL